MSPVVVCGCNMRHEMSGDTDSVCSTTSDGMVQACLYQDWTASRLTILAAS